MKLLATLSIGLLLCSPVAATLVSQPYPDPPLRDLGLSLTLLATVPDIHGDSRPNGIVPYGDDSGRLLLTDRTGVAYTVARNGTVSPLLDARSLVPKMTYGSEQGLQAAVPHPKNDNLLLTVTTESVNPDPAARLFKLPTGSTLPLEHYDVVAEWNPATGKRNVLMVIEQWGYDHNTNQPLCLADGSCLIPVGDGGNTVYSGTVGKHGFGQRLDSPLGTLLRIIPNGDGTYAIPKDNPFVGDGDSATLAEIYAYGFRNPQRGFVRSDGTLVWIDMGQANAEEVNAIVAGGNYGWPRREGHYCVVPDDQTVLEDCGSQPSFIDPVAAYDHGAGLADGLARRAIGGIAVCEGCGILELEGDTLAIDLATGALLHQLPGGLFEELLLGGQTFAQRLGLDRVEARLGVDETGGLLLISRVEGTIYHLQRSAKIPVSPTLALVLPGLALLLLSNRRRLYRRTSVS
jgi:hypothetical protein